jgi:hypothetical protein
MWHGVAADTDDQAQLPKSFCLVASANDAAASVPTRNVVSSPVNGLQWLTHAERAASMRGCATYHLTQQQVANITLNRYTAIVLTAHAISRHTLQSDRFPEVRKSM